MQVRNRKRHQPPQSAQSILQMLAEVRHNVDRERFELYVAGDLVGTLGYQLGPERRVMTIMHTVLYEEFSGHGLAGRLSAAACEYATEIGARVDPMCTYTRHYLETHPGAARVA